MKNLFFKRKEEEVLGPAMRDPLTGEIISLDDLPPAVNSPDYSTVKYSDSDVSLHEDIPVTEIINGFYSEKSDFSDKTKSIFKMEEFMATMPESLPMNVKLQTVINVLITSGFDPEKMVEDGQARVDYIHSRMAQIQSDNAVKVEKREKEISNLESQIDNHRQVILETKKNSESVEKAVHEETERLTKLINDIISVSGKKEV